MGLINSYFELLKTLHEGQTARLEDMKRSVPMFLGVASLLCAGGGVGLVNAFFQETRTIEKTRTTTSGHLLWKHTTTETVPVHVEIPMHTRLAYLFWGIGLLVVAALCIAMTVRVITTRRRLKTYAPILKGHEAMQIQQIMGITGSSRSRVYSDLQTLIRSDAIADIYIDYDADKVVSTKYIPETSLKTVVKCSECGGNNELIVGITKACSFCAQPLLLQTT